VHLIILKLICNINSKSVKKHIRGLYVNNGTEVVDVSLLALDEVTDDVEMGGEGGGAAMTATRRLEIAPAPRNRAGRYSPSL
jgi:hypothetical protein